MSARDVIAGLIHPYFKPARADRILSALTSSGYRILGPDEVDAATVEKCAEVVNVKAAKVRDKGNLTAMVVSAILSEIATAIRALSRATHQGAKSE